MQTTITSLQDLTKFYRLMYVGKEQGWRIVCNEECTNALLRHFDEKDIQTDSNSPSGIIKVYDNQGELIQVDISPLLNAFKFMIPEKMESRTPRILTLSSPFVPAIEGITTATSPKGVVLVNQTPMLSRKGVTHVIVAPKMSISFKGPSNTMFWVNGLHCNVGDTVINEFGKVVEVMVIEIA